MKKLTTEEFVNKARAVHGDKYDYSEVRYINTRTKVCIICKEHGEFWQLPNGHLSGCGCPKCGINKISVKRKLTLSDFLFRSKEVHGDLYDYSKVEYKGCYNKVCIICHDHGEFWQKPYKHLQGRGCPKCSRCFKKSKNDFIELANKKHNFKYDYSKVNYINANTKVCIICPEHREFWQTPGAHLYGQGCPKCANELNGSKKRKECCNFINEANAVHKYKYDYSKVKYVNSSTKVCITCPKHGDFYQRPNDHLNGCGCPICNASHGELKIEEYLKNNNIKYESQYPVKLQERMFSRNNLKIDFYLPEYNTFVEFNGEQHYKFMEFFHKTEDNFQMQVERDKRLKDYCKENKIKLIVIKYNQINKIEEILNKKLKLNNKH